MEKSALKTPTRADVAAVVGSAAVPILALLWAMQPGNPYGYFVFLRIVVCIGAFVFAAIFAGEKREMLVVLFAGIAILFNPLFPVHLTRDKWLVFDALTIVAFCIGLGIWLVGWRKRRSRASSTSDA